METGVYSSIFFGMSKRTLTSISMVGIYQTLRGADRKAVAWFNSSNPEVDGRKFEIQIYILSSLNDLHFFQKD